jgi:hypothetical protein
MHWGYQYYRQGLSPSPWFQSINRTIFAIKIDSEQQFSVSSLSLLICIFAITLFIGIPSCQKTLIKKPFLVIVTQAEF